MMTVSGSMWRIGTLAVASAVLVQCSSAPPPSTATSPPPVVQSSTAPAVQPVSAADLGPSWHSGCPLAPQELRRAEVHYISIERQTHPDDLILHEDLAAQVTAIV